MRSPRRYCLSRFRQSWDVIDPSALLSPARSPPDFNCSNLPRISRSADGARLSTKARAIFRRCEFFGNSDCGVHAQEGARASFEGCLLFSSPEEPQLRGVLAIGKGSCVSLAGGLIRGHSGDGVLAESGAEVSLEGVVVEGQGRFGLRFTGAGTSGVLNGCRIRGADSAGLIADGGSAVVAEGCRCGSELGTDGPLYSSPLLSAYECCLAARFEFSTAAQTFANPDLCVPLSNEFVCNVCAFVLSPRPVSRATRMGPASRPRPR